MELDENDGYNSQQGDFVEIYSKNAVLWFSILFDPLVGGILLAINLWVVGYKKAVALVVAFILVFEAVLTYFEYWFPQNYKLAPIALGSNHLSNNDILFVVISKALQVLGAIVLIQLFYKRYFPEKDYYPRSIIQPLVITIFLIMLMSYYRLSF